MQNLLRQTLAILSKYKIESILIVASILIAITSFVIFLKSSQPESNKPSFKLNQNSSRTKTQLVAEVSGAVKKPGVYELFSGARIKDLIARAGGLSDSADQKFFSRNFNLARYLLDQEKVYVPSIDEVANGVFVETQKTIDFSQPQAMNFQQQAINPIDSNLININAASLDQLDSLSGVGKTTAQKIIDGRPYQSVEDLINKKIVKQNIFDQIKDQLTTY